MTETNADGRADGMIAAELVVQRVATGFEEQAARATSGSERGYFEACSGAAQQCAQAVRGARVSLVGETGPAHELARLADYILQHRAGDIADGESAVDAAIRLLGKRGS